MTNNNYFHRYRSYPPDVLIDLVARILALVPPWTRIYRVQRDIPMPLVSSGVEHGNLRELALARMKDLGTKCRDVRTREVLAYLCTYFNFMKVLLLNLLKIQKRCESLILQGVFFDYCFPFIPEFEIFEKYTF